jgi:hypothetical protein
MMNLLIFLANGLAVMSGFLIGMNLYEREKYKKLLEQSEIRQINLHIENDELKEKTKSLKQELDRIDQIDAFNASVIRGVTKRKGLSLAWPKKLN